jgi:hypothetical protein
MTPVTFDHRPLTGETPNPARQIILSTTPVGVEEHLVHGWDALGRARAGDGAPEALIEAEHRARCAQELAESLGERSPRRRQALEDVEALLGAVLALNEQAGEPGISFEAAVMIYVIEPLRREFRARRRESCGRGGSDQGPRGDRDPLASSGARHA